LVVVGEGVVAVDSWGVVSVLGSAVVAVVGDGVVVAAEGEGTSGSFGV
jgi:hypothetical protein